jgi:hypothetical protein
MNKSSTNVFPWLYFWPRYKVHTFEKEVHISKRGNGKLRQDSCEFQASLNYVERHCLKKIYKRGGEGGE